MSPILIFISSPIDPDCWIELKIPIRFPNGFGGGVGWDWDEGWFKDVEDCVCCCYGWGANIILAMDARLPILNGICIGGGGGWVEGLLVFAFILVGLVVLGILLLFWFCWYCYWGRKELFVAVVEVLLFSPVWFWVVEVLALLLLLELLEPCLIFNPIPSPPVLPPPNIDNILPSPPKPPCPFDCPPLFDCPVKLPKKFSKSAPDKLILVVPALIILGFPLLFCLLVLLKFVG